MTPSGAREGLSPLTSELTSQRDSHLEADDAPIERLNKQIEHPITRCETQRRSELCLVGGARRAGVPADRDHLAGDFDLIKLTPGPLNRRPETIRSP